MKTLRVTLADIIGPTGTPNSTATVHARYVDTSGRGRDVHLTDGTIVVPVRRVASPDGDPEVFDFDVYANDAAPVREVDYGHLVEVSWTVVAPTGAKTSGVRRVAITDDMDAVVQLGLLSTPTPVPPYTGGYVTPETYATLVDRMDVFEEGGPVWSVNGENGVVTLDAADVGAATAAQGALADSAVQPEDIPASAAIMPTLVTYPHLSDVSKRVLFHTGTAYYATLQSATGTIYKSTDSGTTWTTLGNVGFEPWVMIRLATGTLLAVGSNPTPTVARSVNDGATWAVVAGVLNYAPLGHSGITETASGAVMIGEYGNVGSTVYRIRRSMDDGLTWATVLSSPGTDGASDPGHIHSVTYDKHADKYVAFMDRTTPNIYQSADQGATWTQIGASTTGLTQPNFVSPMYFADHVAWGYDNETNGTIARMTRANFYSGAWTQVETVATLNEKAFYETFPLGEDLWAISGATEKVGSVIDNPGSYAQEIYLVSSDGSIVSGGLSHTSPTQGIDTLLGHKGRFPGYVFNEYDHDHKSWLNLSTSGLPYAYVSMPYTAGTAQPAPQTTLSPAGPLIVHRNAGVYSRALDGTPRQMLLMDDTNRVRLANPNSPRLPEVRLYETDPGLIALMFDGAIVASFLSDGRMQLPEGKYIEFGTTAAAPKIYGGSGSPEGVISAPKGSLYLRTDGNTASASSLYVKGNSLGTAGWSHLTIGVPVSTKTTSYPVARTDGLIVCNGAAVTITLLNPAGVDAASGRLITVKNINAAAATVVSAGTSVTIDGAASDTLAQWETGRYVSDGTQWLTV